MFDFVPQNRSFYVIARFFVRELGRMAADDDESLARRELLLQPMQLGKDMKAVDAAVREEIDQYERAGEMGFPCERLIHVEPVETWRCRNVNLSDLSLLRALPSSKSGIGRNLLVEMSRSIVFLIISICFVLLDSSAATAT